MAYNKYYKPKDIYYYLVVALIVLSSACSIFVQIPGIPTQIRNFFNYIPWIVTITYMVIYLNYTNFKHFKLLLFLAVPVAMYILGGLMGLNYSFNLFRAMLISALIYFVGVVLGEYLEERHFNIILKFIVIATLILAVYVYFVMLGGTGLYGGASGIISKNAIGLILTVPIVIMLFNNEIFYKLKFIFIPFLTITVILCASRTSMVCCLVAIIARIFIGNRSLKEKLFYTVIILGVIIFLFTNDAFYDRVVKDIFLRGNDEITEENVNRVTSGRSSAWGRFFSQFKSTWFIGGGGYAFENFYLDTLYIFGLVGTIPIFCFVFSPIFFYFKDRKNKDTFEIRNLILALAILMLVNGLGESLTPFGPGVKCFVLWLTFGYYMGKRAKDNELAELEQEEQEVNKEEQSQEDKQPEEEYLQGILLRKEPAQEPIKEEISQSVVEDNQNELGVIR